MGKIHYELTQADIEGYDWLEILLEADNCISDNEKIKIEGHGIFSKQQLKDEMKGLI